MRTWTKPFLRRTPQRVKSTIFSTYVSSSGSLFSGRIIHARSVSGVTPRSSANRGAPLNPLGFFKRAVIWSAVFDPGDANEHCISLTTMKTQGLHSARDSTPQMAYRHSPVPRQQPLTSAKEKNSINHYFVLFVFCVTVGPRSLSLARSTEKKKQQTVFLTISKK